MRLRTLLMAACLVALPLSQAFAESDDTPTPQGVDMGPSATVDNGAESPSGHTEYPPAMDDAARASGDNGDNGSTFVGSTPQDDTPTDRPHGTVATPNDDSSAEPNDDSSP